MNDDTKSSSGCNHLSPQQRSLRARLAAHTMHSRGLTNVAPARAAWEARFETQVDPTGSLPVAVRQKRAEHARKAYMAGLALKSARARSKSTN